MARTDSVQVLGPLETKIMSLLWSGEYSTVKAVHCQLRRSLRDDIAYTTVMSTMVRLADKGVLHRELEGVAYRYTPMIDRQALAVQAVRQVVHELLDGNAAVLIDELQQGNRSSSPE
jgi:predicted transcriptional regulator